MLHRRHPRLTRYRAALAGLVLSGLSVAGLAGPASAAPPEMPAGPVVSEPTAPYVEAPVDDIPATEPVGGTDLSIGTDLLGSADVEEPGDTSGEQDDTLAGPCDGDIDIAEIVTCKITSPTGPKELDFDASAQDRIRVRVVVTGGSVNPVSSVLLGAATVCAQTYSDDYTCAITANGEHTLLINPNGSGTGDVTVTLQRLNDPVGCKPVAYGTDGVTAEIGKQVEIDCFTRSATAGDRLRIRVVESGGTAAMYHEVIRPDGTTVCNVNGSTESTCLLDANGEHRILVQDDNGIDVGTYRLVVQRFPDPTGCAAGKLGKSSTVKSTKAGSMPCITLDADAGDRIRIRAVVSGGAWNPLTDVVGPDGTTVCGASYSDDISCPITTSGEQTIFIRDGSGVGQATGEVRLFLQNLADAAGCKPVKAGAEGKTGSISTGVEIDCWTFKAKAGERWRLRVVESGGTAAMYHEVIRPDGTTVCNVNGSTESTCAVDVNGTFTVLVQDDNGLDQGDYRLVLQRFPKPAGCAKPALGKSDEVEADVAGELVCMTVDGSVGDRLRVRVVVTEGAWNPLTEVLAKDGSTICGASYSDDVTCPLTANGPYTVLVRDGSGVGAATGAAATVVQLLEDPAGCVNLDYGTDGRTATIVDDAEIDCFKHSASAGQRWRVRVVESDGTAALYHEVVRPDGSTVCNVNGSTESTCLLDANGTFKILVQDDNGLDAGSYRIVLEKFPGPTGCGDVEIGGAVRSDGVDLAGGVSCYGFSGKAGDVLIFKVPSTGGTWNPIAEVLRNDGTTLCGPTYSDEFTCTLTTNGAHTVMVRDGSGVGAATGTYTLEVDEA